MWVFTWEYTSVRLCLKDILFKWLEYNIRLGNLGDLIDWWVSWKITRGMALSHLVTDICASTINCRYIWTLPLTDSPTFLYCVPYLSSVLIHIFQAQNQHFATFYTRKSGRNVTSALRCVKSKLSLSTSNCHWL